MPVGGKTLHLVKAAIGHIDHNAQRQPDDTIIDEPSQHDAGETESRNDDEGAKSTIGCIATGDGVDDPAGEDRDENLCQCAGNNQDNDATDQGRTVRPLTKYKAEHVAIRIGAEVELLASH